MESHPVALVTAASRGIGAACARELDRRGYRLALLARSNAIHQVAADLDAVAIEGSVRREGDLKRLVAAALERYGRIDAVVNNTGHAPKGELLELTDEDWQNPHTQSLAMFLAGNGLRETDRQGRPLHDDHLLLMLSSSHEDLEFTLPDFPELTHWELVVDTSDDAASETHEGGEKTLLMARSLKLFRSPLK